MLSKLTPSLTYKIWGGVKLSEFKNTPSNPLPLGETWEISSLQSGPSKIADKKLNEICELKYLLKFIDTSDNLSIQVHPGDEYAKEHENSSGKTECWIILEAQEGAGIYLGFKKGITKKEFKTAVENSLDVQNFLNFIPVKSGDYFYVPHGSVHAIGKGITLCEAQQNSGVTYRVWDWNRLDKNGVGRELHIDKAMDVLNFGNDFNQTLIQNKNIYNAKLVQNIITHKDFKSDLLTLPKDVEREIKLSPKEGISILEGEVLIDGERYSKFDSGIALGEVIVKVKPLSDSRILTII